MATVLTLIVIAIVGVIVLLRSKGFHSYVLRTAQFEASDALNAKVAVQDFKLSLSGLSPTLDLYGLVINGTATSISPPLLQAEHLRVGVRVLSLLRREWYLGEVEIHRPVVRLFVDKNGVNNLPRPKSSGQKSNTDIFDLGVRHAILNSGEVYYNDQKSALSADLRDLDFRAGYNPANREYSGTLSYRDGHIQLQHYAPLPHDLQAEFAATPQRFTLRHATLNAGKSKVKLAATVDDYSAPEVQAQYEASVDAGELRRILQNPDLPAGVVRSLGTLRYATDPNRSALDTTAVEGTLSSASLQMHTPAVHTDIRNIGARYSLRDGNLDVREIRAALLGGEFSGTMSVRDIPGAGQAKLRAALRGISLEKLRSATGAVSLQNTSLLGTANGDVEATASKGLKDLSARADLNVDARVASLQSANAIPVTAVIHAAYSAPKEQITLTDTSIRTPQTTVLLTGTAAARSAMQVRLQSNDLHEVETIADLFSTPKPGETRQPLALYGRAAFNGLLSGSTRAPHLSGQLNASAIRLKGSSWRLLRANVEASPKQISLQNGLLVPADRGRIGFGVRAELKNWAFSQTSPFELSLDASQINLAGLAQAAGVQSPVTGTLNATVQAKGTLLNPVGQGRIDITQAKAGVERIESASIRFNGTGDTVHADANMRMPAGTAEGSGVFYPKQKAFDARFSANGIKLEQLQAIRSRGVPVTGVLNVNASGRGTMDDPQLRATVQIPALKVRGETISNLAVQTDVANHLAKIALDSDVVHSHVKGQGTIALTGDYNSNLVLETQRIPLEPLVAAYAPELAGDITGATELHATIRGPLKNQALIEAHATIPHLSINYGNAIQISAPNPINLDYANGVLNLQRAALRGTGTDLQFQGTVPMVDKSAPMSVLLLGTVDLRLAQLFNPDITSSGQLRFDINSYGQTADPNIKGQVKVINASITTPDAPLGVQNGNGVLTLTKDRLLISSFQGKVGSGTVIARGAVLYRPTMQFNLTLEGRGIRMLYPEGVHSGLDMNVTLEGTPDDSRLQGTVNVDQLSFTPDFDLMSMMGQFGGTVSPPSAQGFSNNLQLQLALRSTSGINLVSRQLSVQGAANLNVRGTAAEPVVLGRINLTGGDLIFRGNRYLLQGGTIDFTNPVRTQPSLNVSVNTTIQQYNIVMRFEGPVDRLRTNYTSDPALPPSDIINLLAFGQTTEAATANPNPSGTLGAQSAIASAVSGEVTSRVERLVGISHLSVDPTLGQNNRNPGATVTVQQRVTSKIFVTFSTDVTSTQNQVIQLQYQQSPRLSLSGTRYQNGGFGLDVRLRRDW